MFTAILSSLRVRRPVSKSSPRPQRQSPRPRLESLEDRIALSGVPAAPVLTAAAVSSSQVNLSWKAVSGATSYQIEEVVGGVWKQIGSVTSRTTAVSITGLSAGTTYTFDVVASNSAGSDWGAKQSVTTRAAATSTMTIDHPAAATSYSNVAGSLFGAGGPTFTDVRQGAVGDCWLLASLAEVAARAPQDITSMFSYAGTTVENGVTVGLYNVRLFDTHGVAHTYVVDTELPSGGNYYDHPANGVLWVALAEKAYAQANGAGAVMTQYKGSDSYSALNGGDPAWALQAITGKSSSDYYLNTTTLAADMSAGHLAVLGSLATHASPYIVGSPTEGTHAYAIVGYNPASSTPYEIYNPWGTNSSGWSPYTDQGRQVYGLAWVSATFLSQNFASQAIGLGDDGGDFGPTAGTVVVVSDVTSDSFYVRSAADLFGTSAYISTPAVGTGTGEGERGTRTTDTSSVDALLANSAAWGWNAKTGESVGQADGHHAARQSAEDDFWADAGNVESVNFLRYALSALRTA
jgi:hypothetical protein